MLACKIQISLPSPSMLAGVLATRMSIYRWTGVIMPSVRTLHGWKRGEEGPYGRLREGGAPALHMLAEVRGGCQAKRIISHRHHQLWLLQRNTISK